MSVLLAMTSPQLEMDAWIQEKELATQTTPLSTMDHPSVMKALGKEFQKLAVAAQQLEKLGETSVRNAPMKIQTFYQKRWWGGWWKFIRRHNSKPC